MLGYLRAMDPDCVSFGGCKGEGLRWKAYLRGQQGKKMGWVVLWVKECERKDMSRVGVWSGEENEIGDARKKDPKSW